MLRQTGALSGTLHTWLALSGNISLTSMPSEPRCPAGCMLENDGRWDGQRMLAAIHLAPLVGGARISRADTA